MLILDEEQKEFIKRNFKEAEQMITGDKLDDILLPLDALITYKGFDEDYQLNRWGNQAQQMYDQIYLQNKK